MKRKFVQSKKKKEAQRVNESLKQLNPELAKKMEAQKENATQKRKPMSSIAKKRAESTQNKVKMASPEPKLSKKGGLSKQE